jgi:hypothetical protein
MTRKLLFDLVTIGSFALPLSLALILAALPRPRSPIARALVAIAAAWVVSVAYTIYLYNPAGIAAGRELGWDSPEMQFDNNTIASQLLVGWIAPSLIVALFFAVRYALRRRKAEAQQ